MERNKTIAEVMGSLSTSQYDIKTPEVAPTKSSMPYRPPTLGNPNAAIFSPTKSPVKKDYEFNIEKSLIYDTDSDGDMVARYENYKGNIGNEDRLAEGQSGFEQALHGIEKFVGKTLAYATDSVVGTVYGIGQSIYEGDSNKLWDNDFSNMVDDINQQMDYALPNYYTDEQKSMSFLRSMGTTNFWFNDVGNGLAFVAGALLPSAITTLATGGAAAPKLGLDLAKIGAKLGMTSSKGKNLYRAFSYAKHGERLQDSAKTLAFLARTSNFEAGMEARQNFKQAMTTYIGEFESKNGRPPTSEELSTFTKQARTAANGVYGTNMAILAASNYMMFGKMLGAKSLVTPRTKIGRAFLNAKGLGITKSATGEITQKALTRGAKIRGAAYNVGKPLFTEGLYEEGLQGVVGTTMQNYLEAKYDPSNDNIDFMSNLTDAFSHQYGSKEGWKEMGIGMIIGILGGGIGRGNNATGISPYKGFRESYSVKTQYANMTEAVDRANKGRNDLMDAYNNSNVMTNFKSDENDIGSESIKTSMDMLAYIKSQRHVFSKGTTQTQFDAIIDAQELTEEQVSSLGGMENVDDYKRQQKDQFASVLKRYDKASKAVSALKLDQLEITRGDQLNLSDSFETMFTIGLTGKEVAQDIGTKIDELTGQSGSYSALDLYSTIKRDKGNALRRYNTATKQLAQAQQVLETSMAIPTQSTDSQKKDIAEKRVVAQRRISELQTEIEEITTDLNSFKRVKTFDAAGLADEITTEETVDQAIQKYNEIQDLVQALEKQGNTEAASNLKYLIDQHDMYSQAYRETIKLSNDMFATDFFNSKEGKGITSKFLGKKFKISDDTRQLIKENDLEIARQLEGIGISVENIEQIDREVATIIDENESLSERDKYRIEALLRLNLSVATLNNKIDNFVDDVAPTPETEQSDIPRGDTLRIVLETSGETELDRLNEVINQINQELHRVRSADPSVNKFKDKLQKVADLTAEKRDLTNQKLTDASSKRLAEIEGELYELNKVDLPNKNGRIDELNRIISELEKEQERLFSEELNEGTDNSEATQAVQEDLIKYNNELAKIDPLSGIIESEDYKRFEELTEKRMSKTIDPYEQAELEELGERIDEWQYLTGSIVAGHRLSDLVKTRIFLQNVQVAETPQVDIQTNKDTIASSQFSYTPKAANMDYGQTYDSATVKVYDKDKRFLEVSGISLADFSRLAEVEEEDLEITPDGRNNILVPTNLADQLNKSGKVKLFPNNGNIKSSYSVVLNEKETPTGVKLQPIESKYRNAEEWNGQTMNPEAIYNMVNNDSVIFAFDIKDKFNETLKTLEDYQNKGVIRIYTKDGDFVGVMKGIIEFSTKSKKDKDIEKFRKFIITKDLISAAKITPQAIILPQGVNITVGTVLLGHVNFNYVSGVNGLETVLQPIMEKDLDNIVDIGYVQNGNVITKNGSSPRTTFFSRTINRKLDTKVPFIVVKKGSQNIALPVTLPEIPAVDSKEFTDVLNSSLSQIDKAITLNKMFMDEGYDVIKRDNAFRGYGESNLTSEKLDEMLAELNANPKYNSIDSWRSQNVSIKDALTGASVNYDISNPVHSPKLRLEFEGIEGLEGIKEEKVFDDRTIVDALSEVIEGQNPLVNTKFFNTIIAKAKDINANQKLRGSKLITNLANSIEKLTNGEVQKQDILDMSAEILEVLKKPIVSKTVSSTLEDLFKKEEKNKPC